MKILLTNDDGIYSKGLKAAYEVLKELGEVFIVAPAAQKSAVGRSISIMHPIRVSKLNINDMEVYAVDGTPADSVIIGVYEIVREIPDLTVCGINLGENLSTEAATTSGTVCAALEAITQGSKAIAISQQMPDRYKFSLNVEIDFSFAKKVLRWLAKKVVERGVDLVLNVNIPANPNGKIALTRLAKKMYRTSVEKRFDPRGKEYYWICGVEIEDAEDGTDINALRKGYVSITPISLDITANVSLEWVSDWNDREI